MINRIISIIEIIINELDNISYKNKLIIGYLVIFLITLPIIFILFKFI